MFVFVSVIMVTAFYHAVADDQPYSCDKTRVMVLRGDNITKIVRRHCTGNISQAIDDAVEINGTSLLPTSYVTLKANG
jgi:hypothetical protein